MNYDANANWGRLVAVLDPIDDNHAREIASHLDLVWAKVEGCVRQRHRRRIYVGGLSLASLTALVLVLVEVLPTALTPSAAAAVLMRAAGNAAASSGLPGLAPGQYYYQEDSVSLACSFTSPAVPAGESLTYDSAGTVQSWINGDGKGRVVITPSAVNDGGGHFATAKDQAAWVAAGRPFVPCALGSATNALNGNPANANPNAQGSVGQYVASGSAFVGFGFTLAQNSTASDAADGVNIVNLPDSESQLAMLLASGEINADGSIASAPQVCPADGVPGSAPGCSTAQQLALIEQLLQIPDASAKLASLLYTVMAAMPDASASTNVIDATGQVGDAVSVSNGAGEALQVMLNPATGALLSCAVVPTDVPSHSSSATQPMGSITYGPISVTTGATVVPSA